MSHRRNTRRCVSALPCATVLLLGATAGDLCATCALGQPTTVALSEQVELARLVDLASQRLKVNVEYDATQLRGTATLRLGAGVTDADLWNLTNRLLAARGFTTVRMAGRDDVLSVVRIDSAAGLARIEELGQETSPRAGFVAVAYRLQNRSARDKEFVDSVKQLLAKGGGAGTGAAGSVTTLGEDALVLADLAGRVDQALAYMRAMDGPAERVTVAEVPAEHLSASQLVALATELAGRRDAIAGGKTAGELVASPDDKSVMIIAPLGRHEFWKQTLASLDKSEAVTTVTYTSRYFELKEVARLIEQAARPQGAEESRWRVVEDPLTSALLVTATSTEHEQIAAVIDRLNAAPAEGRRPLRVFKVRNRSVNDVLSVLQGLVSSGALDVPEDTGRAADQPDAAVPPQAPGTTAPSPPGGVMRAGRPPVSGASGLRHGAGAPGVAAGEAFSLTADEGTSSIIAVGEPRVLSQIEKLIQQLDVRQPQVMVQALVVSLNESQSRALGIELEGQINLSADSVLRLSSLFGLSSAGGMIGERSASGGGTGLLLSPGEFAAVIRALETVPAAGR